MQSAGLLWAVNSCSIRRPMSGEEFIHYSTDMAMLKPAPRFDRANEAPLSLCQQTRPHLLRCCQSGWRIFLICKPEHANDDSSAAKQMGYPLPSISG